MALFNILIFPGLLFLEAYALFMSFADRKITARLQNRQGPPWYQPLADFLKLLGKETTVPEGTDQRVFRLAPIIGLAAVVTAYLYIPIWSAESLFLFDGDIIIAAYLLTIPTLCFFIESWFSSGIHKTNSSADILLRLFSYEIPLFMALLAPSLLAQSWSISGISQYYAAYPLYILINLPSLFVILIASQGKLSRNQYSVAGAENDVLSSAFANYSGKFLAILRLTLDSELVVICSLVAAVFLPFYIGHPLADFGLYIAKTMLLLFVLAVCRSITSRIRTNQLTNICWKLLTPITFVQIIINLLLKGVLA